MGKRHETFLFGYLGGATKEIAENLCKELNKTKPSKLWECKIDWNEIEYFFWKEQEEMYG